MTSAISTSAPTVPPVPTAPTAPRQVASRGHDSDGDNDGSTSAPAASQSATLKLATSGLVGTLINTKA
jgi:hypothetical protein